ncbi:tetratricopeptide repeat protein [Marinobacterium aestuariivivens]|uniref:Tetratricopeptide repeat protein n=1 Tax=Marinobacterium aestuariivivens TaxID=1698799 RepID=A0ABW2A2P3_9GAMM
MRRHVRSRPGRAAGLPYCLRGGSDEAFSCDPQKQQAPEDPTPVERDIDDAELYARLAEIKSWLSSEKAALSDSPAGTGSGDIRLPPEPAGPAQAPAPAPAPPLPSLLADARYREALQQAAEAQRQGHIDQVRIGLEQLILQFPERPEAYNNLGVLLAQQGQYSAALEQLRKALDTHPHYARIHDNLRSLYGALAGNTYYDALGLKRVRGRPELKALDAAQDANDDDSIAARVGTQLEHWAQSPAFTPAQRASLYIPGYRSDAKTSHRDWLSSLPPAADPLQLQEYELAVMSPDWVEVTLIARAQGADQPVRRELTLVRNDNRWLISSERSE